MSSATLSPVYLFNGDDVLKQETLVARLCKRFEAMGDANMNTQIFQTKDFQSTAQLLDVLNTVAFGSDLRLVVIKDTDSFSKTYLDALADYAANPSVTTVLALVSKKISVTSRLYKAIKSSDPKAVVDCSAVKKADLPALIRKLAAAKSVGISQNALNELISRVGASTVALKNEIEKTAAIVMVRGVSTIEEEDIKRHVMRIVEPKSWDLTNALALRDLSLCLLLQKRMQTYSPVSLFAICIGRIREILSAQTYQRRNEPVAKAMGKQDWQIREILKGTRLYSKDELINILEEAPKIEQQMKTGANSKQLFELWIVDTCLKQ